MAAAKEAAAPAADYRQRAPKDVRVLVVGATGYIGKFVVRELVSRGYNVVAFARERSGIGGKQTAEDVKKELAGAGELRRHAEGGCLCPAGRPIWLRRAGNPRSTQCAPGPACAPGRRSRCPLLRPARSTAADVRFGDVMSMDSLSSVACKDKVDVVVSCLASRTGEAGCAAAAAGANQRLAGAWPLLCEAVHELAGITGHSRPPSRLLCTTST